MRLLPVLVLLLPLAGCAAPLADLARDAPGRLAGASAAQIRGCMGQPAAVNRSVAPNGGALELWTYIGESSRSAAVTSDTGYTPTGRGSADYDYYRFCEAVFSFRDGRVVALDFTGRTATGRPTLEPCGSLVRRCMAAR